MSFIHIKGMATSVTKPKRDASDSDAYRIIVINAKIIENTIFNKRTMSFLLVFCFSNSI